ncbi:MAG TPA: J domain-containing protein [Candidatus Binatia bacterium]|nr:J domain-containing protein [Candidatus Binatia bacterium]
MIRNRRAALDGLSKILDAAAPEDLFTGAEDEALFLYDLLTEATRGRSSSYYWEICRTARRRGVTPEYVIDRASVLHATMTERRRTDLYRILGVPPLASDEMIRQRWLEVAKRHHPDAGGDADSFRHAKQAFEVLRDPARRAEYERFWLRALGPFERVMPREEGPMLGVMQVSVRAEARAPMPRVEVRDPGYPVVAFRPRVVPSREAARLDREPEEPARAVRGTVEAAARLLAAREVLDRRLGSVAGASGVSALLGRIEAAMAAIRKDDLDALAAEVARGIAEMETLRERLALLASLKQRVGA